MDPILLQADELGIRLEIVCGLPIWEAKPVLKHQRDVDQIRESIQKQRDISSETGCGCIHYADVYVAFPDGSLRTHCWSFTSAAMGPAEKSHP